jgi:LacI family kdg operon repressor
VIVLSTILEEDLQTLLFASNGRMLMDVLTWLIHQEIAIPEKVGVTGFDDWNLTELVGPGITSVEQPSKKIGEVVAKQLLHGNDDEIRRGSRNNRTFHCSLAKISVI